MVIMNSSTTTTTPISSDLFLILAQLFIYDYSIIGDHAILKLSTIRDHIQRLFNNCTQSSIDIYGNNDNSSNKFSTTSPSIIELYITVHSTIPTELSSKEEINTVKECTLLKGSEGPASKPIHLTACLLIMAAGSLETAYKVFGPNLATKLGIVSLLVDILNDNVFLSL
ncbi:unnamed protein product [Schistosoma mattheei]|uniref:Uncharacterized protein n=1 Tax=Schistosoma mattheei TaxID=31246 RepID=A0A183Q2W0_9TREM|nr:unnamed protein product [Schistosoma mattheei]